jgi:stage V sporulation protein S
MYQSLHTRTTLLLTEKCLPSERFIVRWCVPDLYGAPTMTAEATPADTQETILRVSAKTPPQDLASAIAHACYDGKPPTLRAIGAGAVNQGIKALIIANQYVASKGMSIVFRPGFQTVAMMDANSQPKDVSAITIRVLLA